MALKKSELYSSLWASCDELRGGMDASQYKDYVLVLLFVKYVSDRYADEPYAPITIPRGTSFADMVALKGKPDIGDEINKKILGPLFLANHLSDPPDFAEPAKLGSGKEMVERITNLIAIFEDPASPKIAPMATTFSATLTNILCATSQQRVAKAKANSIPQLK
jgi:type I restriction enzyme M protein